MGFWQPCLRELLLAGGDQEFLASTANGLVKLELQATTGVRIGMTRSRVIGAGPTSVRIVLLQEFNTENTKKHGATRRGFPGEVGYGQ